MGNERVINILMAIEAGEDTQRKNEAIATALRKSRLKDVRVNKVDVCLEREEIQRKIAERIYDVFICTESLRGETLGGGTIKRWKTEADLHNDKNFNRAWCKAQKICFMDE